LFLRGGGGHRDKIMKIKKERNGECKIEHEKVE
jgi:hypothetical protein